METNELHTFILDRLAGGSNLGDIVLEVCDRSNLPWPEVEALVLQIQAEHEHTITKRQSPLLIILALGLSLAGLAMIGYSAYSMSGIITSYSQADLFYTDLPAVLIFIVQYSSGALSMMGIGLALVLGSLLGMRRIWAAFLNL